MQAASGDVRGVPPAAAGDKRAAFAGRGGDSRTTLCLLSALRLHGIGTQAPLEVWLAIPQTIPAPRPGSPALRVVRRSGAALSVGIKRVVMDGIRVPVFNPSKTVANCFTFRHKIGVDVAPELYMAIGISGAIQHGSAAAGTGGQTGRHVRVAP